MAPRLPSVWLQYTDIVPRPDVRSPCGHGTRTPWAHGMYNCRVDTVHGHCATMRCAVSVWPRYLWQVGMVSVYCGHTATVATVLAWYPCPDNMYGCCHVAMVSTPSGHGVHVPWPHGNHRHGVHVPWPHGNRRHSVHVLWPHGNRRHGVHVLWPHGNRRHGVGTMSVPRQYVQLLCGHGTPTLWPHGMYNCRVDMVHGHRATTWCMVTVWPRCLYQVGKVSMYRGRTVTVATVVARCQCQTPCMVAVWPRYTHAVAIWYVQLPCGHGTRTPCHRLGTVAVTHAMATVPPRGVRSPCGHGICTKWARCSCTVAARQL